MAVSPVSQAAALDVSRYDTSDANRLKLVATVCCICGIEDTSPVGVGNDFEYRTSADTFLAVRCNQCSLVYLDPRPADEEAPRIYPDRYHALESEPDPSNLAGRMRRWLETRRLRGWCDVLPTNARILDVGCVAGSHLRLLREDSKASWQLEGVNADERAIKTAEAAGLKVHRGNVVTLDLPGGSYDLVLLIKTIEHVSDPAGVLRAIERLLAPGGRLVIVTDNAASPAARLFGGRHWGGYHFPRQLHFFDRVTLGRLASSAGLGVESIGTDFSPANWTCSLRNLLDDWGAPRWLVNCFSNASLPAHAVMTLVDLPLSWIGRGALLRGHFKRGGSPE